MKWMKFVGASTLIVMTLLGDAMAAMREGSRAFQVHNRIRVEYDDNVFLTDEDQQESFKIIEELEFFLNFNLDQTFISLRYRPSYVYWDDRPDDESDFNQDADFVLNHQFTPRLSLSTKDTFRLGELPELIDRGTTVRENDDFIYNVLDNMLAYQFSPETRAEFSHRYSLLRYDDNDVSDREDYDIMGWGLTLRHQVVPETALLGQFRYEDTDYTGPDRDSDSIQVGGGFEQTFNPGLLANARAGWQFKEFSAAIDSDNSPYVDAGLTFLPSPATRITAGLGYAMTEADVFPYANQDRFSLALSLAHDWTARLTWYLSTTYILNQLDAGDALPGADLDGDGIPDAPPVDGDENIYLVSTRLSYRLNRSNSVEAGWQLVNLDSDVQENYTRNRIDVGWKLEL